ncbi:hypothetical protein TNCV_18551 [Trichonephila clavipes]|nr:hypothetical protein TNCV_18551 [Trichonephila clavipes]
MTPELALLLLTSAPHQRVDVGALTDLMYITPLHVESSVLLGSNSCYARHESVTLTTRVLRPLSSVKPPVFSSQASLVLIYRANEGMSQLCSARNLNPRPVERKTDTLPLSHWA